MEGFFDLPAWVEKGASSGGRAFMSAFVAIRRVGKPALSLLPTIDVSSHNLIRYEVRLSYSSAHLDFFKLHDNALKRWAGFLTRLTPSTGGQECPPSVGIQISIFHRFGLSKEGGFSYTPQTFN